MLQSKRVQVAPQRRKFFARRHRVNHARGERFRVRHVQRSQPIRATRTQRAQKRVVRQRVRARQRERAQIGRVGKFRHRLNHRASSAKREPQLFQRRLREHAFQRVGELARREERAIRHHHHARAWRSEERHKRRVQPSPRREFLRDARKQLRVHHAELFQRLLPLAVRIDFRRAHVRLLRVRRCKCFSARFHAGNPLASQQRELILHHVHAQLFQSRHPIGSSRCRSNRRRRRSCARCLDSCC
mmetsp:Transcript_1676/g.3581  ORF Transcript_1676/g.3581 Transcript_1676/m.3581 type:complete len:244 (-) Transcript_1676:322-1053(-)